MRWKHWLDGDYCAAEKAERGLYDNCIPLPARGGSEMGISGTTSGVSCKAEFTRDAFA